MAMKHAIISNVPKNVSDLYKEAKDKSFNWWIDEKGTKKNPEIWCRKPSDLIYNEAFEIIQNNRPHWVISFRDGALWEEQDYWEFGGCNIASNNYGEVFIWIQVDPKIAEEIFKKWNLEINWY